MQAQDGDKSSVVSVTTMLHHLVLCRKRYNVVLSPGLCLMHAPKSGRENPSQNTISE